MNVDVGECSSIQTWSTPLAIDNCSATLAHTSGPMSGDELFVGSPYTILYTATDGAGNTATCQWTITVLDSQDPEAVCQDITIYLDENGEVSITPDDVDGGSSDECALDGLAIDVSEFDCDDTGDNLVTLTVTDASSNTAICVATVTVVDDIPPTIECPEDVETTTDPGLCSSNQEYEIEIDDNCGVIAEPGTEEFIYTGNIQEWVVPAGVTSVTIDVKGASGANASGGTSPGDGGLGGQATGVLDVTPGETLYINVGGQNGYNGGGDAGIHTGNGAQTFAGNGGGASDVRQGGNGVTDRVIVAGGGGGGGGSNAGSCDDGNPSHGGAGGALSGVVGENGTGCTIGGMGGGAGTQIAGGNGGAAGFNCGNSGDPGDPGVEGAAGMGGNGANNGCSQNFQGGPGGGGGGGYFGGGGGGAGAGGGGGNGAGGGGGGGSSYIGGVNFGSTTGGVHAGDGIVTISYEGNNLVQTTGLPSGSDFPVGTTINTFIVTDNSGNTASCSFSVTVTDEETPAIECPPSVSITTSNLSSEGDCFGLYEWLHPIPTDNCEIDQYHVVYTNPDNTVEDPNDLYQVLTNTISNQPSRQFAVGTTTVEYYVEDEHGNTNTCTFQVTVTDDENPEFLSCPADLTVTVDVGNCSSVQTWSLPQATDNCEVEVTQTSGLPSGSTFEVGTVYTILYTAEDNAGNTATCDWTITVVDTQDPDAVCQDITIYLDENGEVSITPDDVDGGSSDDCALDGLAIDISEFDCDDIGDNLVTLTVTDASDNTSICVATVTVVDDIDPTIECPADIAVSNDEGECGAIVEFDDPEVDDNCPLDLNGPSGQAMFSYTGNIETWTVPAGVTSITIEARGAEGGNSTSSDFGPGQGAILTGDFAVTPGQQLKILVGEKPQFGNGNGGGGGTFVTDIANNPLIIAGGGGGSSEGDNPNKDGQLGTAGGDGPLGGGVGGTNGEGGKVGVGFYQGGGGGGLLTDGEEGSFLVIMDAPL